MILRTQFWLGSTVDMPLRRSVLELEFPRDLEVGRDRWHLYRVVRSRGQLQLTYRLVLDRVPGDGYPNFALLLSDAGAGIAGKLLSLVGDRDNWRDLLGEWTRQLKLPQSTVSSDRVLQYPLVSLLSIDDNARIALHRGVVVSAMLFQDIVVPVGKDAFRTGRKSLSMTVSDERGETAFGDAIKAVLAAFAYPYLALTVRTREGRIETFSLRLHSPANPVPIPSILADTVLLPGARLCLCVMNSCAVRRSVIRGGDERGC
ncbi:hypothetical protein R75461_07914 [Paraburkholderia nemoris]|uniref:hypothetical protein n=1 Tax=Paraburkholderia nemoris TaxID=2793076 RepID=UPI00190912BD|nr:MULTISPECIES: hypothetical protein [Paraburkholderia]MBK3786664.1 hypothetical protein [Paraburkholderia aspalathi]CAE6859636.1 hypothetical protein R75461_07914 [Paraburkholderia nemoris]